MPPGHSDDKQVVVNSLKKDKLFERNGSNKCEKNQFFEPRDKNQKIDCQFSSSSSSSSDQDSDNFMQFDSDEDEADVINRI